MNLEIANRLVEYRKRAGYSQEELADKLGISRQAVSKWERVEASPDTDNLIALANLYGVSLDELINGKKDPEPEVKAEEAKKEEKVEQEVADDSIHIGGGKGVQLNAGDGSYVHIDDDGIHVKKKNGEERHYREKDLEEHCKNKISSPAGIAFSIAPIAATILFLIFGFVSPAVPTINFETMRFVMNNNISGWGWAWTLFIFFPVIPSLIDAICRKRFTTFCFPCLVTSTYLYLGMTSGVWHPTWVMFLFIPLFYVIFGPIDEAIRHRRKKKLAASGKDVDIDLSSDDDDDEDDD